MVVDTRSPKPLIPAALGRSAEIDTTAGLLIDLTAFKLKPTTAAVTAAATADDDSASRQHTTTSNCCWLTDCRLAFAARARNLFALILAKR